MRPPSAEREPGALAGDPGDFFIPDLCAPAAVFVMVLLAQLLVFVYALAGSALPVFDWSLLAGSSLFVQWVVLVCALLLCWTRGTFAGLSLPLATALSLGIILAVSALTSWAALAWNPALRGTSGWWVLRNLLMALVIGGIALRYFYLQQQLRLREQLELQARLDSLRSRIRPHFLFNTLNSIASLISSRPESAEQAVEDLSELFRASLKESQGETTVADEIRLCQLYLGIEQLRLGQRLEVRWQVQPGVESAPMPSVLLQPLVENAIYHGIARLEKGGRVTVEVRRQGAGIAASVENPRPATGAGASGNRMALANVEQRLQATYGAGAGLRARPGDGVYRVEIHYLPGQLR